jgi:dinuclear metal center YbgI/SA1388 family protein
MVERDTLIRFLNDYLKIDEFDDYGPQGLQVEGKASVKKIVTAVSASLQLFEKAADSGADMIIVHHGILWDKQSSVVKGGFKNRLHALLSADISLLAYHLPLDKHPEIGNNALAAKQLELCNVATFGQIGVMGETDAMTFDQLLAKVRKLYESDPLVFPYGPEKITRIGICSGGCQRDLTLAIDSGLDAFITGEVSESTMHFAKEGHIHFIAAGHYATERLGIQALGDLIREKFKVKVSFLDIPNPV